MSEKLHRCAADIMTWNLVVAIARPLTGKHRALVTGVLEVALFPFLEPIPDLYRIIIFGMLWYTYSAHSIEIRSN